MLEGFAEDLDKSAKCLGVDGKLKLPKKKKQLSEAEEVDKKVTTFFKKLLVYFHMA